MTFLPHTPSFYEVDAPKALNPLIYISNEIFKQEWEVLEVYCGEKDAESEGPWNKNKVHWIFG